MLEVSVIIPVYNSAGYIIKCIQSVINQTFCNLEILVIDDGSEDSTRELCLKMREKDQRIYVICQEHQGVSAARNRGIKEAKGKYVFFLDSDDTIHPQLIEALYVLLEEKGAGIAAENYCYIDSESKRNVDWEISDINSKDIVYLSNEKAIEYFAWEGGEGELYTIGGRLILRTLLNSLLFDEKLINGEDTLFFYQLLRRGADVVI